MSMSQRWPVAYLLALALALTAEPPVTTPTFEQVPAIPFQHAANPTTRKHLPETMGSGIAVLDVDNDGRPDLFFLNGAEASTPTFRKTNPKFFNRLYRNLGDWKFEDVTAKWRLAGEGYGMGAAAADYDNDGRTDLYVTAFGRNYLYRNTGSRFEEVAQKAGVAASGWSAGAAFLDYNRDGHLDLFVSRYLDWTLEASRWCGEGEGTPRSYCHPREYGRVSHVLYRNRGDGTFEDVTASMGIAAKPGKGLGVRIEDVNGDGWPDILVASDSVAQQLFLNRAGKRFEETALRSGMAYDENGGAYAGMGIDTADVDGDGRPDVFINALARQGYWLYKNEGNAAFATASAESGLLPITDMRSGWGARLADFDNDGWPDLAVAQGHVMDTIEWSDPAVHYREPPLLAKNVFGRFFDISTQAGPAFSKPAAGRGLAIADLDNDGRLDIVISNNNSPASILRNTTAGANHHWIAISLQGTAGNRDAYGSEVIVTTESGRRLRAYANPSGSYLSSSSPILHFGLGREKAASIEITWPGGVRSSHPPPASDSFIQITEPRTETSPQ